MSDSSDRNPEINKPWARVFTCPAGTDKDVADDDLGAIVINPVFSNKELMLQDGEACAECDIVHECSGPLEYVPKK